jgi:peroxiredoxin Q/BCP
MFPFATKDLSRFLGVASVAFLLTAAPAKSSDLLQPGDTFPAWQLKDQTGTSVSSAELQGKSYLLWFYPRAMTPGCTAEGNALRDRYAEFTARGVEIFGISFDTPPDNAAFVRNQGFPYRLLSDTDRTLAVQVGAATSPTQSAARRISYLVGPDGKVLKTYGKVAPATHADQVLNDLPASTTTNPKTNH